MKQRVEAELDWTAQCPSCGHYEVVGNPYNYEIEWRCERCDEEYVIFREWLEREVEK